MEPKLVFKTDSGAVLPTKEWQQYSSEAEALGPKYTEALAEQTRRQIAALG